MSKRVRSKGDGGAPLTPVEQEDRDIEGVVQKRLQTEFSKLKGAEKRCERAFKEAGMRGTLVAEGQKFIDSQSLPKFELKVDCSAEEFKAYIKKRREHIRKVASYNFGERIVSTPPDHIVTFSMTEMMETPELGSTAVSVLQLLCCDWSGYFTLFRGTPDYSKDPKKRYEKGGFLTFAKMTKKMKFPDIFGAITELEQYKESYTDVTEVEIFKGFLKRMTDEVRKLSVLNRQSYKSQLVPLLNLLMFILGECPRFPESEDFVVENCELPRYLLKTVTPRLDGLIHLWSELSKLAFKFFIAIVEFDMKFRESRVSFDEDRNLMHSILNKSGRNIVLNFCGSDGNFNLRALLGGYLRLLKCEKEDIVRIIMRTKHKVTNVIHEYTPKIEEQDLSKLSEAKRIILAKRKDDDNAEYERWEKIRDVDKLKLIDVLLNDLPIV
ncbi:hypothetical protein ZWY2020_006417 [Hordeum vulgare]|nr:hypothetical protein ZWY2020_006417 [Hordeum vulgare]